jgi:predicted ATPase
MLSLPVDGLPDLTAERQKQRTIEILLEQFHGLCKRQPVLAVYEDAHWIDPSTAEFLGLIIERAAPADAGVITFRPEFNPPWTGFTHITSLSLSRLGRSDVTAMIDRVTGGKALPADVFKQISDKTDGIPLFVEELTRSVVESGQLRDAGRPLRAQQHPAHNGHSVHTAGLAHEKLRSEFKLHPSREACYLGRVVFSVRSR